MLTRKQRKLLLYIIDFIKREGVAPSYEEMRTAMNLQSKSGVHRFVSVLVERGYLQRLPHRARAIEVVKNPQPAEQPQPLRRPPTLHVIQGGDDPSRRPHAHIPESGQRSVPLMGKIAAGVPTESIETQLGFIDVPPDMLSSHQKRFALIVKGDSMTGAGILEGDAVILEPTNSPKQNEVVVALLNHRSEATLKRFRHDRNAGVVHLIAENPDHQNRVLPDGEVEIQARMIGLIRRFDRHLEP